METYIEPKELIENPHYHTQRQKQILTLSDHMIDRPIVNIIQSFNQLTYCFTLQCCYGHFIYDGQNDPQSFDPLHNIEDIETVEYRIAYIAFCVENNVDGKRLIKSLKGITVIDPNNIQFCSAEWFWKKQINSFALQVEPDRFKRKDRAIVDYKEALNIEKIRNDFFNQLEKIINNEKFQNK